MDEQNTPTAGTPIYQESQEKNAKWLWLLIVLIIIGALAFAVFRGIGPFANFSPFVKATPTPSSSPVSISTTTNESSPEAGELDKSEAMIRVLNGSGVAGKASSVKDLLEGKGWTVDSVGNADSYDFTDTELRFKEDFKKFGSLLTEDLSSDYSVETSSDDLEASDSADIEIIVGTK